MNFIRNQYKQSFLYFSANVKRPFILCLTGFIFLSIIMHFVFINMPEATTSLFKKISNLINDLDIPQGGWGCFWSIFSNNIRAMMYSIIYGFIPFLFIPVIILCSNIMFLSVVSAYSYISGYSGLYVLIYMILGIVPHGIFEIPAICLSVALGINLCAKLNKKIIGNEDIIFRGVIKNTLRIFVTIVLPLTVIAALVETFITPLIMALIV